MHVSSKASKGADAVICAGLAAIAAASGAYALSGQGFLQSFIGGTGAVTSLSAAIRRHERLGLVVADYANGLDELADDYSNSLAAAIANDVKTLSRAIVVPHLPPMLSDLLEAGSKEDEQKFWDALDKVISGSLMTVGARGSGKSYALAAATARWLEKNPDGRLIIGDPHYDPDESQWLPTVPPKVVRERYVIRDFEKIAECLKRVYRIGCDREQRGLKNERRILLVIDEYLALRSMFPKQADDLAEIIKQIMNRFRKYKVDIWLGLHSFKKGETGLDSSVFQQMAFLGLGDALDDRSSPYPPSWDTNALTLERQSTGKYAAVVQPVGEKPFVVPSPDLPKWLKNLTIAIPQQETDPVTLWAEEHRERVTELYNRGFTSVRKLSDELGTPRGANDIPNLALKLLVAELSGQAIESTNGVKS